MQVLFILVKSLDEVRWQCGVYGHHVFGRRSTQARSSVTAGRCTSCLPHPCGTRAVPWGCTAPVSHAIQLALLGSEAQQYPCGRSALSNTLRGCPS